MRYLLCALVLSACAHVPAKPETPCAESIPDGHPIRVYTAERVDMVDAEGIPVTGAIQIVLDKPSLDRFMAWVEAVEKIARGSLECVRR